MTINNTYITYKQRLALEGKVELYNNLIESGKSKMDSLAICFSNGEFQSFGDVLDKIYYYDNEIEERKKKKQRTKGLKFLKENLIEIYGV